MKRVVKPLTEFCLAFLEKGDMMTSRTQLLFTLSLSFFVTQRVFSDSHFIMRDPDVLCDEVYLPEYCRGRNTNLSFYRTIEDFDNCAPGLLPIHARNYFWGTSGNGETYRRNLEAFKRIKLPHHILVDVSHVDLSTTVLGEPVSVPFGLSPAAAHALANPIGEIGSARAVASFGNLMILSTMATKSLEDVASEANKTSLSTNKRPVLWFQTFMYYNRSDTLQVVRRAEAAGYKAIVVLSDNPISSELACKSFENLPDIDYPNVPRPGGADDYTDPGATFRDIQWLQRNTNLPIVVKGVVTGEDAVRAARAGASAVIVSNQGGRQFPIGDATIECLPEVVRALEKYSPSTEVYMDGGVRSGFDVYKALARGARAAFFGRPYLWGLAVAGEDGVKKVLEIMKKEFKETMMLAGKTKVEEIRQNQDGNPFPV